MIPSRGMAGLAPGLVEVLLFWIFATTLLMTLAHRAGVLTCFCASHSEPYMLTLTLGAQEHCEVHTLVLTRSVLNASASVPVLCSRTSEHSSSSSVSATALPLPAQSTPLQTIIRPAHVRPPTISSSTITTPLGSPIPRGAQIQGANCVFRQQIS
eukprot:2358462-Rhodomonas_salina.1